MQNFTDLHQSSFGQPASEPVTKRKIKLSKDQMASLAIGTLLVGGAGTLIYMNSGFDTADMAASPITGDMAAPSDSTQAGAAVPLLTVPTDSTNVMDVSNAPTSNAAYQQAREAGGPGCIYKHDGKIHASFTLEEWKALSAQQRHEYIVYNEITVIAPDDTEPAVAAAEQEEATIYEHYINGSLVISIDKDNDGMVDMTLMASPDSNYITAYVDTQGDDKLDTHYVFDNQMNVVGMVAIDEPQYLSVDNLEIAERAYFNQPDEQTAFSQPDGLPEAVEVQALQETPESTEIGGEAYEPVQGIEPDYEHHELEQSNYEQGPQSEDIPDLV